MNTRAFRNSLVRWFRSKAAVGALIAALTSALVVAGLLVWGNWDPLSRSGDVPAAVVNEDIPNSDGSSVGQRIVDQVLASDSLDWVQTDLATAEAGLSRGDFLAVLRLPSDLSAKVATLDSANPETAQVDLITDDANNYVSSELVQFAFEDIDSNVSNSIALNFLNEVYDALPQAREQGQQAVSGADTISQEATQLGASANTLSQSSAGLSSSLTTAATASGEMVNQAKALENEIAAIAKSAADIGSNVTALSSGVTATDTTMARIEKELTDAGQTQFAAEVAAMRTAFQSSVARPTLALAPLSTQLSTQSSRAATDSASLSAKATTVNTDVANLSSSVSTVAQESAALATSINDSVVPAATELATVLSAAAAKVPPVSADQRQAFTEVLADPVRVNEVRLNPVSGLGEGLAPLFIPAALFAAAILTFLLLRPLLPRLLRAGASSAKVVSTSYLPGLTWGLAQVGVLLIGLIFIGVRAAAWLPFIATLVLSVACFLAIVQLLRVAFGGFGLYLAGFLLTLQLVTVAGVFPVQTNTPIFQLLHPVMPMSYSVDAVRRTIAGGPLFPNVAIDWAVLLAVTLISLGITWALTNRARKLTVDQIIPEVALR